MKRFLTAALLLALFAAVQTTALFAQGVTTGAVSGIVTDDDRNPVANANVTAVHEPSRTTYGSMTRADGRFVIPGMRVGGPYTVSASHVGYESQDRENVFVSLGVATNVVLTVRERAIEVAGIAAVAERDAIFSADRTGASTFVNRDVLSTLPSLSGRIEDLARLTPQYSGAGFGFSFAGQDNRLNNVTVDGSYFNNSFGLAGQPGDRTGVAPISLAAIEQIQVSVAPYDVRQGNFVGAGVNTVTRSGTNEYRGSIAYQWRDDGLHGKKAKDLRFDPGTFEFNRIAGWVSGPIVQDKLFFFVNFEDEEFTSPGTTFTANTGGQTAGGTTTRVLASDLDQLSNFLRTNFDYETGPYQGYDFGTPAKRFLAKVDYNLSERHKVSVRYNHLDSSTDVLMSNSSSLGFGSRRTNTTGLNFANSNYAILENIRSIVGELNSSIGTNMANNLIVGYSTHDESRESKGTFFPMVDILEGSTVYTSFGFEPFTPNNELRYHSTQLQNNFTIFKEKHSFTFGASAEWYESENVFFPGSQSVYIYNSLADFYTDANDHLANPNRTVSPVTLRRFQVRWMNQPALEKPVQPLEVFYTGFYGQDEWQATDNVKITAGLRFDVPFFGETGFANANADALTFRDENGNPAQFKTDKLPDSNILFSPRVGFNWDARGDRTTQVRGGTGIFTGRPAYVWISNQIGNTGVLTGFERLDNTTARPFHPDPNHYKPANVTGAPASSFELALTDPDFRFPQLWRTDIAVDQRLPFGLIGTAEFLYNRDVNGIYYINANLAAPNTAFVGADNRPRWTAGNRIHANVDNAVVLKNQSEGRSWNISGSVERPFRGGLFLKGAYSYGEAKNTVDPGSIAFGSWNNNQHSGDPNNPGLAFASTSPGHRVFAAGTYRREYFRFGATTVGLFWEGRTIGNVSYVYAGDLNGDGGFSNDLIYIPRDMSEMNFQQFTSGGRTFTPQEQAEAWERYIQQDEYLRENRGRYAERNGFFLPMVYRADLRFTQEVFGHFIGARNGLQFTADIQNFTNLLNKDWGVSQRLVNTQPLTNPGADAQGRATYRMRVVNNELMSETFQQTSGFSDVWRILFSLSYSFN